MLMRNLEDWPWNLDRAARLGVDAPLFLPTERTSMPTVKRASSTRHDSFLHERVIRKLFQLRLLEICTDVLIN